MNNQQKCPPTEHLQALIAGTLAVDDETAVAAHLANCDACQSQIEKIAAPAGFQADVAHWLSDSTDHSDLLSKIIANAEADIHESSRELTMGQPTVSVTGNSLEDSVLSGDSCQKRGYADVEKWLEVDDHPAAVGRLGQFRLTEFIGRGGMGTVFKADDLKLQREVAVKILSPELAANDEACERFLREARAIAALNHDNIVTIHAVGEDAALPYFVMEYVHGHSLQEHLDRRGQLRDSETIRIARHVAKGLAAAHAKGIIHRDIKPANILIQKDSKRAKLTDFGLARAGGDGSLTSAGMLVGTPAFLSPEALEEKEIDERSDLFSLGVTFYRAVTGKLPFEGPTPFATMQRVAKTEFTPPHELVPDVSAELCDIINSLLQRDPNQRIESADKLVGWLKCIRSEAAEHADQELPVILVETSSQIAGDVVAKHSQADARRPLIALASLFVCSLLVYVIFFRDSPSTSKEQGIETAQNASSTHNIDSPSVPEEVPADSEPTRMAATERLLIAEINTQDFGNRKSKGLEVDLPDGGVREPTPPVGTAGPIAGVSSATKASPVSTITPKPIAVTSKPYVVIAEDNGSQSEFDSLRDAILAASSGSTVEIQESGRHTIRRPISLHNIALTVAAKEGVLPTIVADLEDSEEPLIRTDSDLSLRGLVVAAEGDELEEDVDGAQVGALIHVREAMLKCSECRFTAREGSPIAVLENSRSATWIDCELYSVHGVAIHWQPATDGYLVVEQCVVVSRIFVSSPRLPHSANVILTTNAIANDFTFENRDEVIEQSNLAGNKPPRMRLTVDRNLILSNDSLINIEVDEAIPVAELAAGFQWQGNGNTLPVTFLFQNATDDEENSNLEIEGLSDWIKLPSVSEVGSITAESLESLVTESDYDVLLNTPQAFSRIVGALIKARRLPVADLSVEQTLVNAGPGN
jgi:serine/threonine protein kinase